MQSNGEVFHDKDSSLSIVIKKVPELVNGYVVSLDGYIDTYNSNIFQDKVEELIATSAKILIFDLSSLSFIASSGIGLFSLFQKKLNAKGGDLVLFGLSDNIYQVFKLLGFISFFHIFQTLEESIESFNQDVKPTEVIFPKILDCPKCAKKLKAARAGKFKCPLCNCIISIDEAGTVTLSKVALK